MMTPSRSRWWSGASWTISANATRPRAPLHPAPPSRWPALLEVRPIPSEDKRDAGGESCRPGTLHKAVASSHPITRPAKGVLRAARALRDCLALPP